eukprot:1008765-Lingulodinium_polyedra.AAC.1
MSMSTSLSTASTTTPTHTAGTATTATTTSTTSTTPTTCLPFWLHQARPFARALVGSPFPWGPAHGWSREEATSCSQLP